MSDFIMHVKLEALGGSEWSDLIREAYRISQRVETNVEYQFNGLAVTVFTHGVVMVARDNIHMADFTIDTIPEYPPYVRVG